MTVNDRSKLVTVHGCPKPGAGIIQLDSKLRVDLRLEEDKPYDFQLRPLSWLGHWRWAWNASDPSFRIPAQISLISLILGLIGLFGCNRKKRIAGFSPPLYARVR